MLHDLYAAGFWLLAVVGVPLLLSELRDARTDTGLERTERLRLQAEKSDVLRDRRQVPTPWRGKRALPPARPAKPEPLALEVAGLAFTNPPPVIDAASHTAEAPLPARPKPDPRRRMVNPMRQDHEAFRRRWFPGMKENAHAR